MIVVRQILCPVDFSAGSRPALAHAVALARAWNAGLEVLHVDVALPDFDVATRRGDQAAAAGDLDALLTRFVESVAADTAVTTKLLHAADARRAILNEAETRQADILVIGSHGRSGFERFILGSTTDTTVRKASCPVLVVPPDARPSADGRFRRIVCGLDFSGPSLQALRYAIHLAAPGSEVTLLHAIEMPPELRDRQIAAAFDIEAVRAAAENAACERLRAIALGDDAPSVRLATKVLEGRAHRRILETARETHADLIVLGTHGRNALDRWVFGSNADGVLRDAPCPVLTVRSE